MALSGLMSKVHFASKVPLLMKATSADAELPSGLVYDEISRITYESLDQSDVLVEFLTERLKKNSPHIKLKVLMIMKAVIERGHKEFCHSLSKQADGIREARSFNGPSDSLHGDALNVRIREIAGQLLQSLFDTERSYPKGNTAAINKTNVKRNENFSNFNATSMQGFGNNTTQSMPDQGIVSSVIERIKDNISYTFKQDMASVAKYHHGKPDNASKYQQYNSSENKIVTMPSKTFNLTSSHGQSLRQGFVNDGERISDIQSETNKQIDSDFQDRNKIEDAEIDAKDTIGNQSDDWSKEIRLVNDITVSGGIKLNPSRSEMDHFIKSCRLLDFHKIMELIQVKLENSDYKIQMKALFVIENTLNSSLPNAFDVIKETFLDTIESLTGSNQKSVKNKATKILHMLKPRTLESNQVELNLQSESLAKTSGLDELLFEGSKNEFTANKINPNPKQNDDSNVDLLFSAFNELSFQSESTNQWNKNEKSFDLLMNIDDPVASLFQHGSHDSFPRKLNQEISQEARLSLASRTHQSSPSVSPKVSGTIQNFLPEFDPLSTLETVNQDGSLETTDSKVSRYDIPTTMPDVCLGRGEFSNENSNSENEATKRKLLMVDKKEHFVDSSGNMPWRATANLPNTNKNTNSSSVNNSSQKMDNIGIGKQNLMAPSSYHTRNNPNTNSNASWYFSTCQTAENLAKKPSTGNDMITKRKNQSLQSGNGFEFLSAFKPAAFDFVKDELEASKKKS